MARETKAGLLMIMLLCGVFSFMVYKRMHRPSTAMAQQNPVAAELEAGQPDGADSAETAESASAAADPFVADAGGFAEPDAIIRATAPAPIPDDAEVPRRNAAEPERDPFGASVESPPSKPRLPTEIPDDDRLPARGPRRISQVSAAGNSTSAAGNSTTVEPAVDPVAVPTRPLDDFDPFNEGSGNERAETKITGTGSTAKNRAQSDAHSRSPAADNAVNNADSFGGQDKSALAESGLTQSSRDERQPSRDERERPRDDRPASRDDRKTPADFGDVNDPFPDSAKRSPDGFEAPKVVKQPESGEFDDKPRRKSSADPFGADDDLNVQRPAESKAARAAASEATDPGFEAPESSRAAEMVQRVDDASDQPAVKSSVPALTIPSRDSFPAERHLAAAKADDRLGGFRPARQSEATANAFSADERPSVPSFAGDSIPRRVPRPAPVTQIDEDFDAATAARPLVAGDTYQIEPSDNYWMISRKKYGTGRFFMALAQHNAQVITDPKRMRPGVIIATPSAEALETAYPQLIPLPAAVDPIQTAGASTAEPSVRSTLAPAVTAGDESDAGFFVADDGTPMYRVGREDTLSGISQRHLGRSSRWVQVFEMNRDVLTDGNTLKIGAVLRLPADASRVEVVGGGQTFR